MAQEIIPLYFLVSHVPRAVNDGRSGNFVSFSVRKFNETLLVGDVRTYLGSTMFIRRTDNRITHCD